MNIDTFFERKSIRIILFILLFLIVGFVLSAKEPKEIGFLVVVEYNNKIKAHKLNTIDAAEKIVKNHYQSISIKDCLRASNFFEIRTETVSIYIERKEIIRNNGKIKFKKLKQ